MIPLSSIRPLKMNHHWSAVYVFVQLPTPAIVETRCPPTVMSQDIDPRSCCTPPSLWRIGISMMLRRFLREIGCLTDGKVSSSLKMYMKSSWTEKLNVPAPPVMQRISNPICLIVLLASCFPFVGGKFAGLKWLRLVVLMRLFCPVSVVPLGVYATQGLSWKFVAFAQEVTLALTMLAE